VCGAVGERCADQPVSGLTGAAHWNSSANGLGAILIVLKWLNWLGPTIHAAILNREYLRTLAYKNA
jgi:hypothetical protein